MQERYRRMIIVKNAAAGTLESSDAYVTVSPSEKLTVEITSPVYAQYGEAIEKVVNDTLRELDVTEGTVKVSDKGAIDCVIAARVETAVKRGWGERA